MTKTYLYYVKIESIATCTFQNDLYTLGWSQYLDEDMQTKRQCPIHLLIEHPYIYGLGT